MDLGFKKIISGLLKDPNKIVTIADAWVIAKNPTTEQKTLAEARWNVCFQCTEFREKRPITGEPYCFECKCPLQKKIFTNKFNECPQKKWKEVDDLFWQDTQKNKKSIL
jgi:uncharacterized paraquat-inducible protein A